MQMSNRAIGSSSFFCFFFWFSFVLKNILFLKTFRSHPGDFNGSICWWGKSKLMNLYEQWSVYLVFFLMLMTLNVPVIEGWLSFRVIDKGWVVFQVLREGSLVHLRWVQVWKVACWELFRQVVLGCCKIFGISLTTLLLWTVYKPPFPHQQIKLMKSIGLTLKKTGYEEDLMIP